MLSEEKTEKDLWDFLGSKYHDAFHGIVLKSDTTTYDLIITNKQIDRRKPKD